jgi:hypothetical protein
MIQPNEIRIGNWVIDNYKKQFQFAHADFVDIMWEVCEPIPITPEILLNNGWECDKDYEYYKINFNEYNEILKTQQPQIILEFSHEYIIVCIDYDSFLEKSIIPITAIKYIYELQNIFYAIKNKELEIIL